MSTTESTVLEQADLQRRIARAYVNLKKLGAAKITEDVVKTRLTHLDAHWNMFQSNHRSLLPFFGQDVTAAYFKQDVYLAVEEEYLQVKSSFATELGKLQASELKSETAQINQPHNGHSRPATLRQIDLPTFSGNYRDWSRFSELFTALVLEDSTFSKIEKLNYLIRHLSGAAASIVPDTKLSGSSLEGIWAKLRDRYENLRLLVHAQLQTLTSITPMRQNSSEELKRVLDETCNVVTALEGLNRPIIQDSNCGNNDLLVFLTAKKLDLINLKEWETFLGSSKEPPSFEQLQSFLVTRIQVQEAIEAQTAYESNHGNRPAKSTTQKIARSHHISSDGTPKAPKQCDLCQENHFLLYCRNFADKTPAQKCDFVRSKKLCFNCLGRHSAKDCRSPKRCQKCTGKHHTVLHDAAADCLNLTATPSASRSSHATSTMQPEYMVTLLATARVKVMRSHGVYETVRALIDPCSEVSLVAESLVQRLRLQRHATRVPITGVGENSTAMSRGNVQLNLLPMIHEDCSHQVSAYILSKLSSYRPRCHAFRSNWPHLEGLPLADPQYYASDVIEVLLGADVYGSIIREGLRVGEPMMPIAQRTTFGWILTGSTPDNSQESRSRATLQCSVDQQLLSSLERFWAQEDEPQERSTMSEEELHCETHFQRTFQRLSTGRFLVRLPFKSSPDNLGATRANALRSLYSMETKFHKNPALQSSYFRFLEEYQQLGHMGLTNAPRPNQVHAYLPHHGVFKHNGTSSKLRVVFNGSSRSSTTISLNDLLHTGPRLQPDLDTIVSRWRCHKYGLCADIEKMYRQILVHEDDRTFQRILWRPRAESSVQEYCLNTVTYGLSCAPYLALRTLKQLAHEEKAKFPIGARILSNSTYVDDILTGADTIQDLQVVREQLTGICTAGGFPLAKWSSNLPDFATTPNSSDSSEKCFDTLQPGILGLRWNTADDALSVGNTVTYSQQVVTKRIVLGQIAQIFDPLGWLAPFTSAAKIFMQSLWSLAIAWDDELPSASKEIWSSYLREWDILNHIQISRWNGMSEESHQCELHGFCDASERAYAAVVYLRVVSRTGEIQVSLHSAKTKVAPLKQVSLPRLELCGAVLLSSLVAHVLRTGDLHLRELHLWTDSTVALGWIRGHPTRWKTYVANRVSRIQTLLPQALWHHVPGSQNPADCASRGLGPQQLATHTLWWTGPTWLKQSSSAWPDVLHSPDSEVTLEARHCCHVQTNPAAPEMWDLVYRYSSWTRLLRITAWCQRWGHQARPDKFKRTPLGILTPADLRAAQDLWVSSAQRSWFRLELETLHAGKPLSIKSTLLRLNPILDSQGLLRVGGRLCNSALAYDMKHPLIIPRNAPITPLIIDFYHRKQLHGGVQMTLAALRQQFWIPQSRREVKRHIHQCLPCLKWRSSPPMQLMGDLPERRVTPTRPFLHSGLDYAGPMVLKIHHGRGYKTYKGFIAVFVCHATRAVHLELVSDYSTNAFLAAFKRFTARRGICSTLTSDCGTNFIGADAELRRLFRAATRRSQEIISTLAQDGTMWCFNPPAAPHMNGLVEAAVKSTKRHLRRVLGATLLTYEEMSTFLAQVEACLNSRPLLALSDDPEDLNALTPGHFLVGAPLTLVPESNLSDTPTSHLSRWQKVRQLTEHFWTRWAQEYLQSLQSRQKWTTAQRNVHLGDLCLIRCETTPPSKWPLGRVIQTYPGADGYVRVVDIKTARSILKRPIAKLVLLPMRTNEY